MDNPILLQIFCGWKTDVAVQPRCCTVLEYLRALYVYVCVCTYLILHNVHVRQCTARFVATCSKICGNKGSCVRNQSMLYYSLNHLSTQILHENPSCPRLGVSKAPDACVKHGDVWAGGLRDGDESGVVKAGPMVCI